MVSPVFCSIEEWLGRNTDPYYAILGEVGKGSWHPERDTLPWVRFCLIAHYQQAATLMKRNAVIGRMWLEMEKLRKAYAMPERVELAMMDAAFNYKVRNGRYRQENNISDVVASRDLKRLCDLGLPGRLGRSEGVTISRLIR